MLALSRKVGEKIYVGDDIVIEVLGFQGKYVRLGITAPKETKIYREEIYMERQNETHKDGSFSIAPPRSTDPGSD